MSRNHFNPNRVCSSDKYEASKKAHRNFMRRSKEEGIVEIHRVIERTTIRQHCYISCFGQLVEITEIEAARVEQSVKIIRK